MTHQLRIYIVNLQCINFSVKNILERMYENIFAIKINQIMVVCKDLQKCMLP